MNSEVLRLGEEGTKLHHPLAPCVEVIPLAATRRPEDVVAIVELRLRVDDIERQLRKLELPAHILLAGFCRDRPHSLVVDVAPPHGGDLLAPLCSQETEPDDIPELT